MSIIDRMTLRMRIFIALVVMILFTAVIIGVLTFLHFQQTTKVYHENRLARKEKTIIETIDYTVTAYEEEATPENIRHILENKIFEFADINDIPINVFDLNGNLLLSSEPQISGQRKTVPSLIIDKISPSNDRFEVKRTESDNTFLTTYSYIYNLYRQPLAIVSLPYNHDDSFLREELISLLERFMGVVLAVLAIGALVSWWISKTITGRLNEIAEKVKSTQVVMRNAPIEYYYNDEVKVLVDSYNDMLHKLNDQSDHLLRTEREETWREAARQMAHELKNPLTPMRLQMQSFQRKFDPQNPESTEMVNELTKSIIKQIDTLSQIAEAFSDYTKLPARKDQEINLIEEIETTLDIFDPDVIHFHYSDNEIPITFDTAYITRIITNLIKNSLQAIPAGRKPEIHIHAEQKQDVVEIKVIDNGTGVPNETAEKLFEPKFTTKSSGSGLGLALVRKMLEEYDGKIRFRNNPENGATFIVTLPFNHILNEKVQSLYAS
ncbi:MAG: ATP-binding protein [Flavobacteriaceae bacterium]|nr:ATP-binding protein [Flavobacteriaceae bacterium]